MVRHLIYRAFALGRISVPIYVAVQVYLTVFPEVRLTDTYREGQRFSFPICSISFRTHVFDAQKASGRLCTGRVTKKGVQDEEEL